jgi:hypothetical protein
MFTDQIDRALDIRGKVPVGDEALSTFRLPVSAHSRPNTCRV